MCVFVKTRVQKRGERAKERERRSWCVTGVGWEGLKKHHKHWPLTSLWDWWGCDLSIIYLQQTHKTHKHTHTTPHYACCHTCWWGLRLCDERRHGRVWIQPVAEHVWRSEVKDGPRESAHLWTDRKKDREMYVYKAASDRTLQIERKKEMRFFLYSYIFILILVA